MENEATPTDPDSPLLVDSRTAAAMLSISERTLFTLTSEKAIPVVRIRRAVRYRRADVAAYVNGLVSLGSSADRKRRKVAAVN